jgi:hypothetical protein
MESRDQAERLLKKLTAMKVMDDDGVVGGG